MASPKGLGKGLGALLGDELDVSTENSPYQQLPIYRVEPNPEQPRQDFDPEELQSLSDSIAVHGILQPLTVRALDNGYYYSSGYSFVLHKGKKVNRSYAYNKFLGWNNDIKSRPAPFAPGKEKKSLSSIIVMRDIYNYTAAGQGTIYMYGYYDPSADVRSTTSVHSHHNNSDNVLCVDGHVANFKGKYSKSKDFALPYSKDTIIQN